jgi:hypothetical protein
MSSALLDMFPCGRLLGICIVPVDIGAAIFDSPREVFQYSQVPFGGMVHGLIDLKIRPDPVDCDTGFGLRKMCGGIALGRVDAAGYPSRGSTLNRARFVPIYQRGT